ncbi:MAG: hypothetical protein K6G65_06025, partial [Lachnospiraceae bacterium]|nr:hypothetical protein [Lachnospiraceae bacterium]
MFELKEKIVITSMIALIGLTGCAGPKGAAIKTEEMKQEADTKKDVSVEQSSKPKDTKAEYKGINVVKSSDKNTVVSVPNPREVTEGEKVDISIYECEEW